MSQILQDRDESELKQMVDRFILAMKFQHHITLPYADIASVAKECMNHKVTDLLSSWSMNFSVPELLKIVSMLEKEAENKPIKKELKPKTPTKTTLQ